MTAKASFYLFLFLCVFGIAACGDDDVDCDSTDFTSELQAEIQAISDASLAFTNDPSTANCEAFRDAYQTYLNALRPYGDCTLNSQQENEFNASINSAEMALDDLQC